MKILDMRHIGFRVDDLENSIKFWYDHGFVVHQSGNERINGVSVKWVKLIDKYNQTIELLTGGANHISFTVDEVDKTKYYFVSPSGYKIQFEFTPEGMPVEYVEIPKEDDSFDAISSAYDDTGSKNLP